MTRDDLIKSLKELLENLKECVVPGGMTYQATFDVVVCIESAIEKAIQNDE